MDVVRTLTQGDRMNRFTVSEVPASIRDAELRTLPG